MTFPIGGKVYVPNYGWGEVTQQAGSYGYYVKFSPGGVAEYFAAHECFDHEHRPAAGPDPRRPIDVAARERAKLPW